MKDQEARRRLRSVEDTAGATWCKLSEIENRLQAQRLVTLKRSAYLGHLPPPRAWTREEWDAGETAIVDIRTLNTAIKLLLEHLGLEMAHVERDEHWELRKKGGADDRGGEGAGVVV